MDEQMDETIAFLGSDNKMPDGIRESLLIGLRSDVADATDSLTREGESLTPLAEKVSEATVKARTDGEKIQPFVIAPVLSEAMALSLFFAGTPTPHIKACATCSCNPEGGAIVDWPRSIKATKAATVALKDSRSMVIVTANNPFRATPKAKRSASTHTSQRVELPPIGTELSAMFGGRTVKARIVEETFNNTLARGIRLVGETGPGQSVGRSYPDNWQPKEGGAFFTSLSDAAKYFTWTNGARFWNWEGK